MQISNCVFMYHIMYLYDSIKWIGSIVKINDMKKDFQFANQRLIAFIHRLNENIKRLHVHVKEFKVGRKKCLFG